MKKNTILSIMTCAALLLLTAACSNDENSNPKEQPTQAVQFSFTNEDFGADETLSRATSAAETKPQTVDLGDCEAEISVESEPAVKTRGTMTNANGHYTIRAYQGGTLKGEMKGTFSGGNFTPDASSSKKLNLPYGTYDFIAFNDQVTVSGTELKVDRTDAETARMGFATVNINSGAPIQVLFTMKHVGARVRVQFLCQKHIPENITATLEQTAVNVIPSSVTYNPATKAYICTNSTMTAETCNSPANTYFKYGYSNYGMIYAYTSTSGYHYFLPTTEGAKVKLVFSGGTVFWKPLSGTIPQLNATLQMQANKSYLVKIKLKPNYTYLMSDGTIGHFKDTTFGGGSKTPVGVVGDPTNRVAIALNESNGGTTCHWANGAASYGQGNSTMFTFSYVGGHYHTNYSAMFTDMDGYKWTWEPSYDGSTIKADNQTDYPAFYHAGHYNPGVPLSGTLMGKKWFLPSSGQWLNCLFRTLGFGDTSELIPGIPDNALRTYHWYVRLADIAFTQVGGTSIHNKYYWTSTEYTPSGAGSLNAYDAITWNGNYGKTNNFSIRSFIKY